MCRIMAITSTGSIAHDAIKHTLDRMLFTSFADEGQRDGWGVTDGETIAKSPLSYPECFPGWWNALDPNRIWAGHVRKASANTGRTIAEAHPYQFDLPHGPKLMCLHNGLIQGSYHEYKWKKEDPNTDSFRVFLRLATMLSLEQREEIDSGIITQWINGFEVGSQFTFALLFNDKLHLVRGEKGMFGMTAGNGFIFNTSEGVLNIIKTYAEVMHGVDCGPIAEIPKMSLTILDPGSLNIESENLVYDPRPAYNYKAANTGNTGLYPHVAPSAGTGFTTPPPQKKENETGSERNIPITDDTAAHQSMFYLPPPKEPGRRHKKKGLTPAMVTWKEIVRSHQPMRALLLRFWVAQSLGYWTPDGVPDVDFIRKVTQQELELFKDMTHPLNVDAEVLPPFDNHANIMLNSWGHCVNSGYDDEFHNMWIGANMFWMHPRYRCQEAYLAAEMLRKDIASYAIRWMTAPERTRMLNTRYLEGALNQVVLDMMSTDDDEDESTFPLAKFAG